MDDRRPGPRGRTGRPWWRQAGALAAVVAAALLASACGGSPPAANTFAPGATHAQALAFAKCMHSNGVPQFPGPDARGNFNTTQIEALRNTSQTDNAVHRCRSVLPNAGTGMTVTQIQQMQQQNLRDAVKVAHCMRAHGITNFPDPAGSTQEGSGINWQPVISAIQAGGLSLDTPSYDAAFMACNGKLVGGPIPPEFDPGSALPSGPPPGSPPPVSGNGS